MRQVFYPVPLVLALSSFGALAQTTTPAPVGVTPQTAEKANEKAVQRNDTGTVVRTAPPVTERVAPGPSSGASAATQAPPAAGGATPPRAPRADRG